MKKEAKENTYQAEFSMPAPVALCEAGTSG